MRAKLMVEALVIRPRRGADARPSPGCYGTRVPTAGTSCCPPSVRRPRPRRLPLSEPPTPNPSSYAARVTSSRLPRALALILMVGALAGTSPQSAQAATTRRFPIAGCSVSYTHSHHDYPATDIFAAKGCHVVAPIRGTITEVSTVDRWSSSTNRGADRGGLSFALVGTDGVRYYGSHLYSLKVRAGQHVAVGTLLGTVGNSGDARGGSTHLHFGLSWPTRAGIWWVRRGEVYPWSYLDSWKAGGSKSPAAAVAAEHQRQGTIPPCRVDC